MFQLRVTLSSSRPRLLSSSSSVLSFSRNPFNPQHKLRSSSNFNLNALVTHPRAKALIFDEHDTSSLLYDSKNQQFAWSVQDFESIQADRELIFLGTEFESQEPRFAFKIAKETFHSTSEHARFMSLRKLFPLMSIEASTAASQASMLLEWNKANKFCGSCGGELDMSHGGFAKYCKLEKRTIFPKIEPCVIMLVVDVASDKVLLARGKRHAAGHVSCLAGFMDIGENVEEAVRRETFEESGVQVNRVRFVTSQPWPFPRSLMIGFIAEAVRSNHAGDIPLNIDHDELVEAVWLSREELQNIVDKKTETRFQVPHPFLIANHLMRFWLQHSDSKDLFQT